MNNFNNYRMTKRTKFTKKEKYNLNSLHTKLLGDKVKKQIHILFVKDNLISPEANSTIFISKHTDIGYKCTHLHLVNHTGNHATCYHATWTHTSCTFTKCQ